MTPKMIAKIGVDIVMTILLLFLMAYELVGQAAHEWLGIGIFVLFVAHHILNRRWFGTLPKGKYTPLRIWQTVLAGLVLLSMLVSLFSGILLSRSVFSFFPLHGRRAFGRTLHMLSAYWGFVLMSLHLGLHWSMIMGIAGKRIKKGKRASVFRIWGLRAFALIIASYGIYAFVKRDIGNYMLRRVHFAFFDYEEPLIRFLLDYVAVMGLFVFAGHYLAKALKLCKVKKKSE